jgi:hypothetical protein
VIQSADKTVGQALQPAETVARTLEPATHTVLRTATSALGATSKTTQGVVAPILKTAAPTAAGTAQTVAPALGRTIYAITKAAAPALQSATRTINQATAGPVLQTATRTIEQTVGPSLQSTTHTYGKATAPGSQSMVKTASQEPLGSAPERPTFAPTTSAPTTSAPPVLPSAIGAHYSNPGEPSSASPACPASSGLATEELVEESCGPVASAARPSSLSTDALLQGMRTGLPTPLLISADFQDGSRQANAPGTASVLIPPHPVPTPLSGGSSSAMASGAGVAFSIFLVLAGLLSIGSLAAMRLLRLASEPWRVAPLVLIPERPG